MQTAVSCVSPLGGPLDGDANDWASVSIQRLPAFPGLPREIYELLISCFPFLPSSGKPW
ncbi:hypothetical protein BDY21DRAFT_330501 [Lineolata rhizophorae]|uniref:Uncharacterized protein n=1 Tax=Lineolata rhizophorae TaxID=578093 RepID=A0A6A6PEC3_9PEZI|nr:hypothetical protein BDY21DRAFT_330501 [Lineolata rhizophorae]